LIVGLMSGTSADGIDAVVAAISGSERTLRAKLLSYTHHSFSPPFRRRVLQACRSGTVAEICELNFVLGEHFARAALTAIRKAGLKPAQIAAIGSHGQTVHHLPNAKTPSTLQIGEPSVIAERTGITTVADFRRRDVAAGGQGAPLVPAFHAAIFRDAHASRAILNIGGIANLTLLPASGAVRGFDTGPGNGLMDAWCLRHRGQRFDRGGAFAASGQIDARLLSRLLAEPWFALAPPKSTGRDQFHLEWLETALSNLTLAPEHVQATLCELTVRTVVDALLAHQPATDQVLVCGGGVHNTTLLARLAEALPGIRVQSTAASGVDPDLVEAMAFAWLARETLLGRPGNLPAVTGAKGPRILGAIHSA
jgi:anhydro-N-acetylmuramic acid kinase